MELIDSPKVHQITICVCETLCSPPPCGNKVRKSHFSLKGHSQDHKVIDIGVIKMEYMYLVNYAYHREQTYI